MAKLIAITLLQTCIIAGLPRSPVEGTQMVLDDEAKRLVDAGMAEFAEVDTSDDEDDDGDGLDTTKVVDLRKIAKDEGVTVESDANKAAIVAAIRAHRSSPELPALDDLDEAQLRELAEAEGATLATDVDAAGIRTAIEDHRASKA